MASPRDVLFDLAVNKAAEYIQRLGLASADPAEVRRGLEIWYLKTRFAYRVPLDEVAEAVARRPASAAVWHGGRGGAWAPADAQDASDT